MKKKLGVLIASLGALFLTVSCSGDSNENSAFNNDVTGNIVIDGSSTVFPLTEIVAEQFSIDYPKVRVTVSESGTGGGMQKFVKGDVDMVNASRKISDAELQEAEKNGIKVDNLLVGNDGIVVVTNKENDFLDNLSKEELHHIFRYEDPAILWSDVREGFPEVEIKVYSPGTASGTFEFFTEVVNNEAKSQREDAILSEDDNVLIKGISGDKYSIGYFGISYYLTNKDKLNLVGIDNVYPDESVIFYTAEGIPQEQNEATEATENNEATENVETTTENGETTTEINDSKKYLLSRPLYLYFDKNKLSETQVDRFLRYYLDVAWDLAQEVGLVGLPYEMYIDQFDKLSINTDTN